MFENETVFILGAGASWHYGFPTGAELIEDVINQAKVINNHLKKGWTNLTQEPMPTMGTFKNNFPEYILDGLDLRQGNELKNRIYSYGKLLEELEARLSTINPTLIDYFLYENKDLQEIGRFVITHVILNCEIKWEQTRRNKNNEKPDLMRRSSDHRQTDDWYKFILNKLTRNCHNLDELINKNHVTFITFNYDTSLEGELYSRLSQTDIFLGDKKRLKQFIQGNVLHIYGKTGILDEEIDLSKLTVNQKLDLANGASKNLLVIDPDDKIQNEHIIKKAIEKIKTSTNVYLLGYGFDDDNNSRLELGRHLCFRQENSNQKRVYFTNFQNNNLINKRAGVLFCREPGRFLPPGNNIIAERNFVFEMSTRDTYQALAKDFDLP